MLVLGLLVGAVCGLLSGFIPGFSAGLIFILLTGVNPDFAVGVILAADAVGSVIKQLGILTPVVLVENTYLSGNLPKVLRKGQGIAAVLTGAYAYTFVKMLVLVGGIILLMGGVASRMSVPLADQPIAIAFAGIMWGALVIKSPNKVASVIILTLAIGLGWMTTKLSGSNLMFALITAVIGIPGAIEMIKSQSTALPPQTDRKLREEVSLGPVIAGAASSVFMGLPTAAIMAAAEGEDEKDLFGCISKSAVAEAAASAFGLILVVSGGGSRSAAATLLSNAVPSFGMWTAVGLLGLTLWFTLMTYMNMEKLADLYMATVGKMNQKVFGYLIVALSVGSVVYCAGLMGIVLIVAGFCLNKMIQASEAPKSFSLSAFSAIPLLSLLGI